ncbi:hypothetical protein ACFE04_019771 [Oxalis oulophora]
MSSQESFKIAPLKISSNALNHKKAILLHYGGPELQDVYAALEKECEAKNLEAKDHYEFALEVLDAHFRPTATNCGFADLHAEIVDQIILGTSNPEFRASILEKRLESLEDVLELGKLTEAISLQTKHIAESEPGGCASATATSADSVARVSSSKDQPRRAAPAHPRFCDACGRRNHVAGAADCPAKDGKCYTCERTGHFSNRCPDKPRRTAARRSDGASASSSRSQPANPPAATKRDDVKLVTTVPSFDSSDDSDYSFAVSSSQSRLPAQLEANRMEITVGGVATNMYVDSMASRERFSMRRLGPLDVEKAVIVEFCLGTRTVTAKAYVLGASEGRCESILGSKVAKELGVLRVGCPRWSVRRSQDEVICSLAARIHAQSKASTGKLKNFKLALPQDHSVSPVAQACRRIPYALPIREKSKEDREIQAVLAALLNNTEIPPSVWREKIEDADSAGKQKGKEYADSRRHAAPRCLAPGDAVLLKTQPVNKLTPTFDENPFTVTAASDREVTLTRNGREYRRSIADVRSLPDELIPANTRSFAEVVNGNPPSSVPPLAPSTPPTSRKGHRFRNSVQRARLRVFAGSLAQTLVLKRRFVLFTLLAQGVRLSLLVN